MTDVVTLGETMGLFTATEPGPLTQVDAFRLGIGGAESNVAIGLARLGMTATWIGRVGADEIGDRVRRELRAENVDAIALVDDGAPTGMMVKSQRTAGHTRVAYYRAGSAGSRLSPDDLVPAVIEAASVLHVTGITPALSASASAAVFGAVDLARRAGVAVSFDVNHRSGLWGVGAAAPVYRALAEQATVVFAGLDEAALLADGSTPAEFARAIADLGPSEVVVKLGADGCHALIDGTTFDASAIPVSVVDTVGAGDAFVAGYLAERVRGADAPTRLATATRAGAFACRGRGDWESLPFAADLLPADGSDPVRR